MTKAVRKRGSEECGRDKKLGNCGRVKPTRLTIALHCLKHTYGPSDEETADRWVESVAKSPDGVTEVFTYPLDRCPALQ